MSFGVLALIVLAGLAGPLLSSGRRALVPVVVGELAAGVVIGRSGFGWLDPSEPTTAFLAEVGFAMLMFVAGMHVPLRQPGLASGVRRGGLAAVIAGAARPDRRHRGRAGERNAPRRDLRAACSRAGRRRSCCRRSRNRGYSTIRAR